MMSYLLPILLLSLAFGGIAIKILLEKMVSLQEHVQVTTPCFKTTKDRVVSVVRNLKRNVNQANRENIIL